jgi:RNA polymerase sigma-70 factor (ECF subfamily)
LAALPEQGTPPQKKNAEMSKLLHLYVERFNRRDWDGLRELIADDARLRVADKFEGRVDESPYFGNYDRWNVPWQMAVGEVDGEPVIIVLHRDTDVGAIKGVVRLDVTNRRITRIADYLHCPWILQAATSVVVGQSSPN